MKQIKHSQINKRKRTHARTNSKSKYVHIK